MKTTVRPSPRYAEYVRKISCGEWTEVGIRGGDKVVIKHKSGVTAAFGTHDGGNDQNGPRNFAAEVQKVCGCRLVGPRGRKRSRKSMAPTVDLQAEASRRRYAEQWTRQAAARAAEQESEIRRINAANRTAADERRRRDIESLMRPGWGR